MTEIVPDSHKDLLGAPVVVTLVTHGTDGYPQATAVWCKYDDAGIHILTRDVTQKYKNIMANSKVSVIAIDPQAPQRYVEVRGEASITRENARETLREVATSYGRPDFPLDEGTEHRVIITVTPQKVVARG